MSFTLEELRLVYPEQLWVELTAENLNNTLPSPEYFSHEAAVYRAYLNLLCIKYLLPLFPDITNVEELPKFESQDYQKSLWEFINGTRIEFLGHRLIIIPSETIDLDEFLIEQEWVDIPELVGDYYLAVQINLEGGWLRVWGFTTHRKLKTEGRYDVRDRTYSIDSEDLFENLNALWVSLKLCQGEKGLIEPLPTLSPNQRERLLTELGKPSLYSPRLKVPFAEWGAFLAADNLRQQLYFRRMGKESALQKLGNLSEKIFHQLWLSLDELVTACNVNLSLVRSGARSGDNKNRTPEISRGRVIDLGIQLVNHPVALILHFTKESENKRNILLQVHPGGGKTYLPPEVELIVLDDMGEVFLEAKSRQADNWIQLEFRGEPGERFSVKVALGDASIVENFVI
ncbi:MAG: hypothetical protein RLZZ338_4607 [Cyanobacteriota bacterium]|jgi:hypothetical protein